MKKSEDIKIGEYTLKEIIIRHRHWLEKDIEGWQNMRADLRHANLSGIDLSYANLSGANLCDANLSGANLCDTNLSYAKLRGAKLRGANLRDADLSGIDLCDTNLSGADLSYANLSYAKLRGADLNYANLSGTDLRDANLRHADLDYANLGDANLNGTDLRSAEGNLMEYRRGKILSENIIGYKKCRNDVIVTLEIPRGAIVFSINGNKCRANKAKVIAIDGADRAFSMHMKYMSYYVGDEITIYDFNCEYNVECAEGIHFFMTQEEAEEYI